MKDSQQPNCLKHAEHNINDNWNKNWENTYLQTSKDVELSLAADANSYRLGYVENKNRTLTISSKSAPCGSLLQFER